MSEATSTGAALPLTPGTWKVDPNHSGVYFKVRHLGLSNVRGQFKTFDATIAVGNSVEDLAVSATIDLASVDTNQPDRDGHLLSTDFFAADKNPQIAFASTGVSGESTDEFELAGDLTINGITKAVSFPVEFNGVEVFPGDGKPHAGFTATAVINRKDFGVDFNMPIGIDKVAISDKVNVELDLQFVAPDDAA